MEEKKKVIVYIDESSTLGKEKQEPYFIIGAIVLDKNKIKPIKNLVKKITKDIRKTNHNCDELHSAHMNFTQKQYFFNLLKTKNFSVQYFVARKDQIKEKLKKKSNIAFNYFVYLLLKNLLNDKGINKLEIIIDMRSIKVTSEKSLEEYLQLQLIGINDYKKDISVSYGDSKNYKLLQAVDMVVNAIFAKYNFNKNHFYSYFSDKISHRELFPHQWFKNN